MSGLIQRLRDMAEFRHMDRSQDAIDDIMRESADRIEELERQLAEAREASQKLHRRAQTAEGKLQRMEAAHEEACRIAFTKSIDYHLYASILLNCNKSLFPKLVNKGAVVTDGAAFIRNQALEEAAKLADTSAENALRLMQKRVGGEYPDFRSFAAGCHSTACLIRALSDFTPTSFQEQNANTGKDTP